MYVNVLGILGSIGWEVSHFWQIERETLEVWQIFAREHYYFVLFVKRKQATDKNNILTTHHNF